MERGVFMNKFLDAISDKLLPLANKLGSNRYLAILRDSIDYVWFNCRGYL